MSETRPTVRDCDAPWTWYQLGVDGAVRPCCYGSLPVGRVTKESPEEIWNNPTLRSLRSSLSAGVVHTVCARASCKFVQGPKEPEGPPVQLPADFDEAWYRNTYVDVAEAVSGRSWKSGADHYQRAGHREFRAYRAGGPETSAEPARRAASTQHLGYIAGLTWLDPVCPGNNSLFASGGPIMISFRAKNLGLRPWLKIGNPDGHVYGAALLHARLEDIGRVSEKRSFRMPLARDVAPGESVDITLRFDPTRFLESRLYLLLDLGCDERFCFSAHPDSMSMPLVASLERGDGPGPIVLDPGDPVDLDEYERLVLDTNRRVGS